MGRAQGSAQQPKGDGKCVGVVICDLADAITESELRQVFQNYGDLVSLEYDKESASARVQFADSEAAEEAQSMLNHSLLKDRPCRCLMADVAQAIRSTMESGQRLVIESLDPGIEGTGLRDLCQLFGTVLDCKVEFNEDEESRGFGFVHYADREAAAKAMALMDGMQIGSSTVELRVYETSDMGLFTGCSYVASEEAAADLAQVTAAEEERHREAVALFKSMSYHYVEVIEGNDAKLRRLKALIEDYGPDHERQMLVVAGAVGVQAVASVVRQSCEDTDYACLEAGASELELKSAVEGFITGNLYVIAMASEVALRDIELRKAAVLVNMDFPRTLPTYLQRIYKRADKDTRVHSLFSSEADKKLVQPLMSMLEDVGHHIPDELVEIWSKADNK